MAKKASLTKFLLVLILLGSGSAIAQQLSPRNDPALQRVEPFKVFDNLYYVGAKWVSAWLIDTGDGLVLIDALYDSLTDIAIDGIEQLGFDPADIKYVLVTHGHYDHVGGAKRIQDEYGATVAMLQEDWDMVAGEPVYQPYPKPAQQLVIADGDSLSLGNTHFTFYKTPGHTPGVMSMKFNVIDAGQSYVAFMFAGVGLNFSTVARTQMYIDSVSRLQRMRDVQVNITNHEGTGRIFERNELLKLRQAGQPHSFVDPQGFKDWLDELMVAVQEKMREERAALK